jgi:catechol 2,3-dioxygenase-like lactoylglutathione lyase family enzyme
MPRGLCELVLVVTDVARAAAFYREVVGLVPETEPSEAWAWFWAGRPGEAQRVGLHRGTLLHEEHSPRPEGARFGPVHFALHVGRGELGEAVERVRRAGVAVYGPTQLEWMKAESYYFYDPDANLVEFWSPDPLTR